MRRFTCTRCGLPLAYEMDEAGRYTRLFSVGQNGSMNCPDEALPHVPPRGIGATALKLLSRFNEWEV